MGLFRKARRAGEGPAPITVRLRLAGSVDAAAVLADVAAWAGLPAVAESGVRELAPGLLLGGPVPEADGEAWLVLAARGTAGAEHGFDQTLVGGSGEAALAVLAGLVQGWLDRQPAGRGDCESGLGAYALALADGLARRHGGRVAVGDEPLQQPPPREPTRNIRVRSWPDPAAAAQALAAPLPGLVLEGVAVADTTWPAAACGECGLWVEALDADDRLRPDAPDFADGGRPDFLPLNSRADDTWVVHVEGPDDVATPDIDTALDRIAAALAEGLDGIATDTEGFPVPAA